jgi:hypothetical protein
MTRGGLPPLLRRSAAGPLGPQELLAFPTKPVGASISLENNRAAAAGHIAARLLTMLLI